MFHATGIIRKKRTPERERAYMEINASSQLPVENPGLPLFGGLHAKVKDMIGLVTSCGNVSISGALQLIIAASRRIQADERDQPECAPPKQGHC